MIVPEPMSPLPGIDKKTMPNFGKLNEYIWRSGQPAREGYDRLVGMGLKTVVNLRAEYPEDREMLPGNVRYFLIPIIDYRAPTVDQANQFLRIVLNPHNWPILFHCRAGEGRTSVMAALIRYSLDGWTHDTISAEIRSFRKKHWWILTFAVPLLPNQSRFIKKWEESHISHGFLETVLAPRIKKVHPQQCNPVSTVLQ